MTKTEIAILASIAANDVHMEGRTLLPTDVEVMKLYVANEPSLTAYQKRVWTAALESHERLRVEKLLVRIV